MPKIDLCRLANVCIIPTYGLMGFDASILCELLISLNVTSHMREKAKFFNKDKQGCTYNNLVTVDRRKMAFQPGLIIKVIQPC